MALTSKSLFSYGLEVDSTNYAIDFKISGGGSELNATLTTGFYTMTDFLVEVARALTAADSSHTYTVTCDRTAVSNTQNRITITTSGAFLSLLFSTGTRASVSAASLMGFTTTDKTGATSYTGTSTAGSVLVSEFNGYNYLGPDFMHKIYGSVNISANGTKEAVVYQIQKFWQVQFKYEPYAKVVSEWVDLIDWMIQQKPLEFTPEISSPYLFYQGTLEKSSDDPKGLGFKMTEILPNFAFQFDTGMMTFRQKET